VFRIPAYFAWLTPDSRSALPHGTFAWSYATFLFLSAAQAQIAVVARKVARLLGDLETYVSILGHVDGIAAMQIWPILNK
jgi:hypothetical protein